MAAESGDPVTALRVSQLDAAELDGELTHLMKSQILKIFKYHKTSYLSRLDPEVNALLKLLIWHFSTYATGATIGQQILGLKYRDPILNQWMTRRQKLWLGCLLIGCPWFRERTDVLLSLVRLGRYKEKVSRFFDCVEIATNTGVLVNFLVFLYKGCYASLSERIVGIQSYFSQRQSVRQVSFEYMTRELMWHGFSEFLFFILPLVNFRRVKNFALRNILPSPSRGVGAEREKKDLEECALCGEWPMHPQEIGCTHVFCYYCIQSNYKADPSFSCVLCGQPIPDISAIQDVKMKISMTS